MGLFLIWKLTCGRVYSVQRLNALIVSGCFDDSVYSIFAEAGYNPIMHYRRNPIPPKDTLDVAVFLGGTDIGTELYQEPKLPETQYPHKERDTYEVDLYNNLEGIPKVGICRGAQLLNVLNGGKLWQHVSNHGSGVHEIYDMFGNKSVTSSIHHQQMIPSDDAQVVAWSGPISSIKKKYGFTLDNKQVKENDIEVLYYPSSNSLLYQGHPEVGPQACTDHFFYLVDRLIWNA